MPEIGARLPHRKMFALLMAPLFMGGDDPDPGMSSGSSTGLSSNCKLITVRVRPSRVTHVPLPPVTCPHICTNSDVLSIGRRRVRRSREMLVIKEVGSVPVLVVNLPHRARLGEPGRGVGFHRGRRPVVGWSSLGLRLMFGAHRIKWRTVIPGETLHITVHEGRELQPRASAMRILFGHLRFSLQHIGQVLMLVVLLNRESEEHMLLFI